MAEQQELVCYWREVDPESSECDFEIVICPGCEEPYCQEHGRFKHGYCLACRVEMRNYREYKKTRGV